MNRLYLIFSFLIIVQGMKAQTLQGRVGDNTGRHLDAVSVTLLDKGGKILSFAKTDKQGRFTVQIPVNKTAGFISFSRMGYSKKDFPLEDFPNGQTVVMQEEAFDLREVKVTSERIRQHSDTLVFSVAGFKQQQDRSIADVIKKMPGLDVQSNGQITYQGKAINEFTVEGMDLTGGKYAQISENLSADKVKSVEIRENNQPKRVLRNVQFSEQAALNLVLKDDAKNVWQGIIDVATGVTLQDNTEWLRDTRVMGMNFGRKHQNISMWKTNNNGKNIQKEVGTLIFETNSLSPLTNRLSGIGGATADIDRERYVFNNSQLAATNWLFKTKGEGEIRFQASYFFDKTKSIGYAETIYHDIDGGWSMTEDKNVRDYTSIWSCELQYKVNNDKMYLNNRLKANIDFNRMTGVSSLNNTVTRECVKPRSRFVSDAMEMIRKTKGGNSYTLSSAVAYDFLPGTVLLCDNTTEKLNVTSLRWNTMANFRHKLWRFNVAWNMGFDLTLNKMDVENPLTARNNVRYNQQRMYAYPSISYEKNGLRFNASTKISWLRREYESVVSNNFLPEPVVFVNYKPNSKVDYGFHYSLFFMPDDMNQICDIPVFTSYRTMRQGDLRMEMSHSHSASVYMRYHHIMNGLFANASVSFQNNRHTRMYSSTVDGNFYRQYASGLYDNTVGWSATGEISKSFAWAKTIVKAGCSLSNNSYHLLVNDVKVPCSMKGVSANVGFSMKLAKILSIEEKSYFSHSLQKSDMQNNKSMLNNFLHKFKILLLPGKWQIELVNELYHSNDHSVKSCHFSDAAVSYRTKQYEVGVWLNNIMGIHKYERQYDTTAQHVYMVTQLRPREVMAKVLFNL